MSITKRYNDYASLLHQRFGKRVQKISINAGFSCPNRDGNKGIGGCTFCNNQTFSPQYCASGKSVSQQMKEGIDFFRHKYKGQHYLAYFQSFTNTYADTDTLISLYEEALDVKGTVGIVIGTRPDCISEQLLDKLQKLNQRSYVMIEYGVESSDNKTLEFVNRHHTFEDAQNAIKATKARKIEIGAHLILGLPLETEETMMTTAKKISQLPIDVLKLHQLQLIRGTIMEQQYTEHPDWFHFAKTADEYINLVIRFIEHLNPNIAIERFVSQSPAELLLLPKWGLKNFEFTDKIKKRLEELDSYQGKLYKPDI